MNGRSNQIDFNVKLPHSERDKIDMKVFVPNDFISCNTSVKIKQAILRDPHLGGQ